jgi:hypothetical protein
MLISIRIEDPERKNIEGRKKDKKIEKNLEKGILGIERTGRKIETTRNTIQISLRIDKGDMKKIEDPDQEIKHQEGDYKINYENIIQN